MSLVSSLYQPQLPRGSEVELHGLAVALRRGFSMTLHIPLLCGHGSDLSKLLLGGSQATGHSFSQPYSLFLAQTPVDFSFFPN